MRSPAPPLVGGGTPDPPGDGGPGSSRRNRSPGRRPFLRPGRGLLCSDEDSSIPPDAGGDSNVAGWLWRRRRRRVRSELPKNLARDGYLSSSDEPSPAFELMLVDAVKTGAIPQTFVVSDPSEKASSSPELESPVDASGSIPAQGPLASVEPLRQAPAKLRQSTENPGILPTFIPAVLAPSGELHRPNPASEPLGNGNKLNDVAAMSSATSDQFSVLAATSDPAPAVTGSAALQGSVTQLHIQPVSGPVIKSDPQPSSDPLRLRTRSDPLRTTHPDPLRQPNPTRDDPGRPVNPIPTRLAPPSSLEVIFGSFSGENAAVLDPGHAREMEMDPCPPMAHKDDILKSFSDKSQSAQMEIDPAIIRPPENHHMSSAVVPPPEAPSGTPTTLNPSFNASTLKRDVIPLPGTSRNSGFKSKTPATAWQIIPPIKVRATLCLSEVAPDGITISLDAIELNDNMERLNKAIVGKLLGKRVPFHFLMSELWRR